MKHVIPLSAGNAKDESAHVVMHMHDAWCQIASKVTVCKQADLPARQPIVRYTANTLHQLLTSLPSINL